MVHIFSWHLNGFIKDRQNIFSVETSDSLALYPKSEILYGSANAVERGTAFMKNTKKRMDITFDQKGPSIVVDIPAYREGYKGILSRGGKIRCITEVTSENIIYCKELQGLVSELRHIDGLKGGIAVNETEYMATTVLQKAQPLTEVIYSNVDEVIAQGQYIFDTLWKNSIPASRRIRELEGRVKPIRTEVLETSEEIAKKLHEITEQAIYLYICSTTGGMALGRERYDEMHRKTNKTFPEGNVRWLTSINTQKDIDIVGFFLTQGMKIRHTAETPSINFVISDKHFASTTEKVSGESVISNFLVSNDPVYIDHFAAIFDNTWKSSVDASERIRELHLDDFFKAKVLSNPLESLDLLNQIYNSAKKEILILLPSLNSLLRLKNSKDLEKLNKIGSRGIHIKILLVQNRSIHRLEQVRVKYQAIQFRGLELDFPTLNRITIIDTNKTVIIKIKDDNKTSLVKAIDTATFIEGKQTALSYKSIFETLWKQTLTFDKLKKLNKRLQSHGKNQKEFIDILAHEIRHPIQPIIGLTEYVKSKLKDKQQIELLDSVIASGQKLNALTENILDVSRIEDNNFSIKRKNFNLNESILDSIKIFEKVLRKSTKEIKFEYVDCGHIYFINGDRTRIEQVISNLIHNAIKSITRAATKIEGNIRVIIKGKNKNKTQSRPQPRNYQQMVEVLIEDNGEGIDPKVMPNLFKKFTKSLDGNGLGLYISKKIIESHGGRISAKKQKKIGAIFCFSLPVDSIKTIEK